VSGWVVAALNVPRGRYGEVEAGSEAGALFVARRLSRTEAAGVSFGAYEVRPGEGSVLVASFMNGECRFKAAAAGPGEDALALARWEDDGGS
jgi:hypothetical protein